MASTKQVTVVFQGKDRPVSILAEVADTVASQMTGLMNRPSLPPGRGMLFVFPDDEVRSFWMKNVRFPIDIVFVTSGLVVEAIHEAVPPCTSSPCPVYNSRGKIRYAVEVPAGFCKENYVKPNDTIEILP